MPNGRKSLRYALMAGTALTAFPLVAGELPTGASVVHGSVGIATPAAGRMAIQQSTDSAIVSWRGFSIGAESRVDIQQPSAASAILNRVTGATPSTIAGQLNANGQVYLVNPNGIAITSTGNVKAGAFVASTLDIADDDFLAGRRTFSGDGRAAQVTNQGAIEIGRGGYAALLGGQVENSGTVSVPLGRIGFGAGERVTLDLSGDGFLSVAIPSEGAGPEALIRHSGRLSADGGRIEISAATARQAARHAINLSGVVEARTVSGKPGEVVLGGGAGGTVTVSGRIDATAAALDEGGLAAAPRPVARPDTGGAIDITGARIALAGATLDASGTEGGGTIRIGGDYKGGGALPHARTTSVDAATLISADALEAGDGGRVILWSDELTTFDGRISARGGPKGGDGGFAEVSGKARLAFSGRADLSAPAGSFGTLLLDPYNVFIEDGPTTGGDLEDTEGGFFEFFPTANDSVINATELAAQLALSDVVISTEGDNEGTQAGNITIGAPLSWNADTELVLLAEDAIPTDTVQPQLVIAQPINAPNGALVIAVEGSIITPATWSTSDPGVIGTGGNGAINVGNFVLSSGDWIQNGANLPNFQATSFAVSEFASFLRARGGDGTSGNPYLLSDVYGLQGVDTAGFDQASFALASDIDASGTANWNFVAVDDADPRFPGFFAGFDPIGEPDLAATPFGGTFDGRGHTISNLFIDRADTDLVGLFGQTTESAVIQNIGLMDADILGENDTGGLVGQNFGAVRGASVTGNVVGDTDVGGLIGSNIGTIESSYSEAGVVGFMSVGGLVGENSDSIAMSYAQSSVSGVLDVGGLVGENFGSIFASYAVGAEVAGGPGAFSTGGLAGTNFGTITAAFVTGEVSGGIDVGGLVGTNFGTIALTYSDASVTGTAGVGGLVGGNEFDDESGDGFVGTISTSYARGSVTGADDIGGLVGRNSGIIDESYAAGPVAGADGNDMVAQGGLVGSDLGGEVTSSFWSIDATGQPESGGGTGLSTAVFQDTETFIALAESLGWNFQQTWAPPEPGFYPALYAIEPVLWVVAEDVTAVRGFPPGLTLESDVFGGPGNFVFSPPGDSLDVANVLSSPGIPQSAAGPFPNVGTYPIIAEPAVTSQAGVVYRVVSTDGLLTVTPAPLIITALDAMKLLGIELTFSGTEFSVQGLLPGDAVRGVTLVSEGAAAEAPISGSPFPIFVSDPLGIGLFGDGFANYEISFVPGELTIVSPLTEEGAVLAAARFAPAIELPDPGDEIVYGGGGGPIIGLPEGRTDPVGAAEATLDILEQLAGDLEGTVEACRRSRPEVEGYLDCLGTALDQYAAQIDQIALDLPEPLRGVSATIQQASREIAEARDTAVQQLATAQTPAERTRIRREAAAKARAAITTATAEIRKQIALIRADEPQVARLQVEQGDAITAALDVVGADLERVVGL